MSYLLFFAWLIVIAWSLTKIRFVKNAGLGSRIIIAVFICKVIAGLAGGWITHNDPVADTWGYHRDALKEYHLLFNHPGEYFTNLFYTGYANRYEGVFQAQNSYWNDLKTNLIVKLVSVFDIFSGGNYYINVIFYNFLIFFGHVGLYRVFKQVYQAKGWLQIIVVFLLPSFLYFSSSIHKEGIMLAAVGVIVFNVYTALHHSGFTFNRLLFIFLSGLLIFLFRNYIVFAMIPAIAAMIISTKGNFSPFKTFAITYIVAVLLFFNLHHILPSVNLPAYMVQKQSDFLRLEKGNTTIDLNILEPSFKSYISNAPQALQHSLCRPFFTDISLSKLLLPLSLELIFYEFLLLAFLVFKKRNMVFNHPVVLFGLFFGVSVCLTIGYTVPVIGAIVRYRSIYLPFLLAPFIFNTDWKRALALIKIKK